MQSKNKLVTLTALLALVALPVVAGCADTATCDPDEMLVDDLCLPMPPPPAPVEAGATVLGAGTSDASTSDAEAMTTDAGPMPADAASVTQDSGTTSADAAVHSESR